MSLITCGSIHEGHEWFSDDSRGRQEIFMCLAALLFEQFCRFANVKCQDIDQVLLHEIFFFSVYSAAVKCQAKLLPFEVNCRLQPADLLALYISKATSVPQTPHTNHSQYSSPVEVLNLIVESKSQPVELDNPTIELHVPSRRKISLQSS